MATEQVESQATPGASRAQLYRWQTWVHVGPGADNCEDVNEDDGTVECNHPLHFHAWVRLPNPFQHNDIREKALAAKARRIRLLRHDGSDLNEIMEEEIETLARKGEAVRAQLVEEMLGLDWWRYLLDATRELQIQHKDPEDEESPLVWEHIEDDRLRLLELRELPEDERPADELKMLEERIEAYDKAIEAKREELAAPDRAELEQMDISALFDRVRDLRIDSEGSKAYQNAYAEQEWIACTYRFPEGPEWFQALAELHGQPSDVITAISAAFADLEREQRGVAQGNS